MFRYSSVCMLHQLQGESHQGREKQIVDFNTGSPWETVTLTALGRNRQLYTHILDEGINADNMVFNSLLAYMSTCAPS